MKRVKRNWKNLVEECEQSGLSAVDFCRSKNISLFRFYLKKKEFSGKYSRECTDAVKPPTKIEILDVTPKPTKVETKQPTLKFSTPDGLSVEVFL